MNDPRLERIEKRESEALALSQDIAGRSIQSRYEKSSGSLRVASYKVDSDFRRAWKDLMEYQDDRRGYSE